MKKKKNILTKKKADKLIQNIITLGVMYYVSGIVLNELVKAMKKGKVIEVGNFICTNKAECCDHIIPVIKGSLTIIDNLQASCNNCNLKKGSNMIL